MHQPKLEPIVQPEPKQPSGGRFAGLFVLAILLTVLVGVAPFLPGQDSARSRLRQYAAGAPLETIKQAPRLQPVGAERIGAAKPGTAGIDLGAKDGTLELVGLTEEVWLSLPDGRKARMHLREVPKDE